MAGVVQAQNLEELRSVVTGQLDPGQRRAWRHRFDFVRAVVGAQFRTEFDQYFLGWLWWALEPLTQAMVYMFLVYIFLGLGGDRPWIILLSVIVWQWFSRSVYNSPPMMKHFAWYTKYGGVPLELLYFTSLVKEACVFFIALGVVMVPISIFNGLPLSWNLWQLPIIFLCQALVVYCVSGFMLMAGALFEDVGKVVGIGMQIWWYFSPGMYIRSDVQHIPPWLQSLFELNPFWTILPAWQNVLVRKQSADLGALFIWIVIASVGCVVVTALLHRWRLWLVRLASE